MCGIAGIYACTTSGLPLIRDSWLRVLDDAIAHRGPDGSGIARFDIECNDGIKVEAAFVHRRLSIIDPQSGAQPMTVDSNEGKLTVAFNGCIYNHRALRSELRAVGCNFSSDHSDTEVIPFAWRRWRVAGLRKLDGMFAFALLDHATGELVLARDLAGEKPLYFREYTKSGVVVFASSPAPIFRLDPEITAALGEDPSPIVDSKSVQSWIRMGCAEHSPFYGIRMTPPGAVDFRKPSSGTRSETPWTPVRVSHYSRPVSADRTPSLEEFEHAISGAVRSRLEADVPSGCFLSGGIDSALIAAMAAKAGSPLPAFTVRMPDADFDESAEAAQTAAALGLRHHVLECEVDPVRDLETLIAQTGLPFADSSLLPTIWVSRAARQHVKVALGGDGGDELFMGYERHRAARLMGLLGLLGPTICGYGAKLLGVDAPTRLRSRMARLFSAAMHREYSDLVANFPRALEHSPLPPTDAVPEEADIRECARAYDFSMYLPNDLLRKTDSASMSVALEVRSPLLAREVVDLALACPVRHLLRHGRKWILKSIARRHLPAAIVDRPKRGFAIPIGRWLREDFGGMGSCLADIVNSGDPWPSNLLGLEINHGAVRSMYDSHMNGSKDHSQRLYGLLVLAIWCRLHKSTITQNR